MRLSGKLRRICKESNAAVREVIQRGLGCYFGYFLAVLRCILRDSGLDIAIQAAYMYLHTHRLGRPLGPPQARYQSRTPQAARRLESASGTSPCPLVPQPWFLRRPRSGPGEIRDAPAGARRGGEEGCSRSFVWRLPPDPLPGRSSVRAARIGGLTTAAARSEEPPQAHARGHGVHRCPDERRAPPGGERSGPGDTGRTRPVGPPPQCRARPGAQKKTIAPIVLAELPASLLAVYERLRAEVLRGQSRPEGLGAVVFHGFAEGLKLLCRATASSTAAAPQASSPSCAPRDRELLHLLANMVLQTQSEVMHVY